MAAVTVRAARQGDGVGCARAWVDAGRHVHDIDPAVGRVPDSDGLAEWFEGTLAEDRPENEECLVAEVDGRVVGFVSATVEPARADARWQIQRDLGAPRLVIEALAVRESHRRSGVGGALMRAIEGWGRERGAAVALTDTNLRSPLSLPFYERGMGYARRGVILRKGLHAS